MKTGVLICALFFLSCASPELTRWPSNEVTYSIEAIHLDGVDLITANKIIHKAFKAWEATGAVKFKHVMHGQIKVSVKALKGNQGSLLDDVQTFIDDAIANGSSDNYEYYESS